MSGKKAHFEELLKQPKINRSEFNKSCFQGRTKVMVLVS